MTRNILLHLLFFLFVFPVKSEYSFEEIKELVPKLIIKDEYSLFYKIFKYHVPYNENYLPQILVFKFHLVIIFSLCFFMITILK